MNVRPGAALCAVVVGVLVSRGTTACNYAANPAPSRQTTQPRRGVHPLVALPRAEGRSVRGPETAPRLVLVKVTCPTLPRGAAGEAGGGDPKGARLPAYPCRPTPERDYFQYPYSPARTHFRPWRPLELTSPWPRTGFYPGRAYDRPGLGWPWQGGP